MSNRYKPWAALGMGLFALLIFLGIMSWAGYRESIHVAETTTRGFAAILETRLDATLRRADAELRHLAHTIPLTALNQDAVSANAQIAVALKARLALFPELAGMAIFDVNGDTLYASHDGPQRPNIADRSHFRSLRDNPRIDSVFSEVIISRNTGKPSFTYGRALRDEQGVFRGAVVALLGLEHFQTLFQALDVGSRGVVAVYRRDNFTQVLRWPAVAGSKLNAALPSNSPARALLTGSVRTATYELTASTDNITRIYSGHALDPYPFFITVGVARDEALAAWRARSLVASLSTLLLMGLLIGLLVRLWRGDVARAGLLSIIDASNDAIVSRDLDGKVLSWNRGAEKLFGYSAAEMVGQSINVLIPPERNHELRMAHEAAVGFQARTHDSVRIGKDGRLIDVSISAAPIENAAGSVNGIGIIFRDIAERKQAEAARGQLAAIVEGSNVAIFSRAFDGTILTWNAGAERMLGYTAEEAVGKPISFTLPPGEPSNLAKNNDSVAHGDRREVEFERLTKDGQVISVLGNFSPIRDHAGNIIGVSAILQDITATKQAQAAVSQARQRLEVALEGSHISVWETDLRTNGVWLDATWSTFLGLAPAETRTNSSALVALVHPDDRQIVVMAAVRAMKGEISSYAVDHRVKTANGEWLWIHSRGKVVERDTVGRPLRMSGTNTDISERRAAEAKLRISTQRLQTIFDTGPQCVKVIGADGELLDMNAAGLSMLEAVSLDEARSRRLIEFITADCREAFRALHQRVISGEHGALTYQVIGLRGTRRWLETQAAPMVDADGQTTLMLGVSQDITERKAALEARSVLEAQLRESQKMQAIGTLAGGIAHDFNNIIAAILGNTELARQDAEDNSRILESLAEIHKAGVRARDLVQQILAFSRRQPTERKRIDLAHVVAETARLLRATLPARLTLDVHCDPQVPLVLADASHIQQCLINLATNAMQAMPHGPGWICIRLDTVNLDTALANGTPALNALYATNPGHTVRLAVSDSGPGMDAVTLQRLFEPFYTTKPVGEGTGLGLSVVHGIVQVHEGAIVVESELGRGATFTMYLPVADEATASNPETGNDRLPPLLPRPHHHILYIDDDEALVFLVKRLLERSGYRVSAYTDQQGALDALRADPAAFDLVVSDYNMPGMSGLDVARAVCAIRRDLPVAVTSGFIDETLSALAAGAGVRELIFKADNVETFCAAIGRLAQSGHDKPKQS